MAQQLGAPDRPAVGDLDPVVATKLYVPPRQPGFVPRPRLVEALDEGLARALTVVSAPAGFGKTALLADWGHQSDRALAWLSLDAGDNDPARFWRHGIAALDRVRPGLAMRLSALLGPPAPPSFDGLVTTLVNELVARPGDDPLLLVLDDYNLIDSRAVHESLTFLLEHLPPRMHLILSTREDPPLALARLRGRGQLAELRAADLRFTIEEAAALLRDAVGPDLPLPDTAVAALADRTEGWAAGLQLAALSMRGRSDVAEVVATFSASHRYILDYLTQEVLERQPDRVTEFLLETSVLERLSGELCDAVTGRTGGQTMLETVARANLFLVPLDEVRGWWRYHQLFADVLRARLQQQQPGRVPALHRNAAAWSEEHGFADEAVRHALAAADPAWAARIIERHVDALLLRSEGATVRRWLAALPVELASSRPRLCLAQAQLALDSGGVRAAESPLDAAERALVQAPDEPFEPSVGRAASLLANIPAAIALLRAYLAELRGDADGTSAFAARTLAEIGESEWIMATIAEGHLALAEWLRGRLAPAEQALSSNLAKWRVAGAPVMAVWGCHYVGQVQRAQGRLDAALATYQLGLEIGAPPGAPPLPAAGTAYVGMAAVARERGELDAALEHVTDGIALCRQLAHVQPLATGLATQAWIRQAAGDAAGAKAAMREAMEAAPGPEVADLLNPVPAQAARLLLAQGDVGAAVGWIDERGLDADDEPSYPREPADLLLARVLLAQDRVVAATRLLDRLLATATAQNRVGSAIEIQGLQALAHVAEGDEEAALDALTAAVTLAAPEGYVSVFADEGTPMRALLGRLVATRGKELTPTRGVSLAYLSRLGAALQPQTTGDGASRTAGSGSVAIPGLIEALSERELEVLRLLAAGKANREIADELFVTLDTVKKHTTHILGKLGATNRTEAAARARDLGLVG
jgi:LuxR family maltose regulon positive regulatory protein